MVYKNIKKYWRIFLHLQKINWMKRMAYPGSFLFSTATIFLTMALSVLFINVNFSFITNLAGWSYYQMLAVVASYMIIEGVMWAFLGQLNSINGHIMDGTLDGVLLRPIDDQFLVSFWRGDPEDSARIVTGLFLLVLVVKNTIGLNAIHLFLYLLLLTNGLIVLYSFNLAMRAISFWVIDGSGLWLLMERVTSNSQFPVDIYYQKMVRSFLTFIVPLAFISTVPARMLASENIDWKFTSLSFVMSAIFFFGSRFFWKFSLKRYSSASS